MMIRSGTSFSSFSTRTSISSAMFSVRQVSPLGITTMSNQSLDTSMPTLLGLVISAIGPHWSERMWSPFLADPVFETLQLFGLPSLRVWRPTLRGGLHDLDTTGLPHPVIPSY